MTTAVPATAEAQWWGWGWNWGWEPAYYQPASPWVSYYPGSSRGSACCCDPCGCNPCCDPCGGACSPCGSACGPGGCAGGNCAYDAPAGSAPLPDPNIDARPRPSDPAPARPRATDDAPPFEPPTRGTDPRTPSRGTDPLPSRTRGFDDIDPFDPGAGGTPRGGTGTGGTIRDGSTAPAGGVRPFGTGGTRDQLLDPGTDSSFDANKPDLDNAEDAGSVIPQRSPAATPTIDDSAKPDNGPKLDAKSTSSPVVEKTRLARLDRTHVIAAPQPRQWSAVESRVVRK
jgi:hypothetical protein